jgi:gamma-glutamylcyclotransferase (GGCT)/AIG2-like uncharacterized protein YtfP
MTRALFVYGILRTGEAGWRHYLSPAMGIPTTLKGYRRIPEGELCPGIAFAVPDPSASMEGELFWVDAQLLAQCDALEGIRGGRAEGWYERVEVEVHWDDPETGERCHGTAWLYSLRQDIAWALGARRKVTELDWDIADIDPDED